MRTRHVVEWAPFQLASGVSEEQLLQASRELQEGFLAKQPGFVRRDLLRARDGGWIDVVYWADREAAEAAMKAAMESTTCHAYFKVMAGVDHAAPDAGVLLFERVATYAQA